MRQLTQKFVNSVEAPGRYYDGDAGLFLFVKSPTRKSFVQRVTVHGNRRDIGIGSVKWTTLAEARAKAHENRKTARTGGNPIADKAPAIPTFEAAAEIVIALHSETWRDGAKSAAQWRASLRDYALPRLGRKPVDTITAADVLAVLTPIWNEKRETARRVRQRIGAVMKWAIAQGHRDDNPAGDAIGAALPKGGGKTKHQRALPYAEVAGAVEAVRNCAAYRATALAFQFIVLTAARSGEVRNATWAEIDLDAATWTVPGERMKSGREHRVPLSDAALDVLAEAREIADGSGLVFPSVTGKPLSDNTVSKLLRELKIDAVPHGFRSSFRQWAAERTNAPREVAEHALAHVNRNKVEAAYQRSDLFEQRRKLMAQWASFLAAEGADVVVLRA